MQKTEKGFRVRENFLAELFRSHQTLYDKAYVHKHYGPHSEEIVSPPTLFKQRIRVTMQSLKQVVDSSNMTLPIWVEIIKIIRK